MEFQAHTSLVRRSLAANFAFSTICALLLLINASGIFETMFTGPEVWFGLPAGRILIGLGFALLLFGLLVLFFTVRKRISKPGVQFIIYNDLAWVVFSGAALFMGKNYITGWGVTIIVVVALVVLFFAFNQFLGLKFLYQGSSKVNVERDGEFVVMTASRRVSGSSEKAWNVMVDHERYSDVADNIANVEILGDKKMGRGMERRCTGNKGETWTEHAHIWDEGNRYGFIVNTKDPNYPYPLESLNAIWSVEEIEPNQSEVTMRMRLQPKGGLKGGMFMMAMVPMFATVVDKLLGRWASKWKYDFSHAPILPELGISVTVAGNVDEVNHRIAEPIPKRKILMNQMRASDIIKHLDMKPHPEGGHYVETFREDTSTAIYFLLEDGEHSHWHRVHGSAELWHHYAGDALELMLSSDGSKTEKHHLGLSFEKDEKPMVVVPAGCWQMARSLGAWTLVGCTVAPGFDFANFEMAPPDWQPSPS